MAAYHRVYDSHHLQADCQELGSAPAPTFGNRVSATFTFFYQTDKPIWFLLTQKKVSGRLAVASAGPYASQHLTPDR